MPSHCKKEASSYPRVGAQDMNHRGVGVLLVLLDWTDDVAAHTSIGIAQRELDGNSPNYAVHD